VGLHHQYLSIQEWSYYDPRNPCVVWGRKEWSKKECGDPVESSWEELREVQGLG